LHGARKICLTLGLDKSVRPVGLDDFYIRLSGELITELLIKET